MRYLLLTLALGAGVPAFGGILFTENFESVSGLADGNWSNTGSASIVNNPLVNGSNSSAKVVHFGSLASGGDLYSKFFSYSADPEFALNGHLLSFDFDFLWTNTNATTWAGTDRVTSGFSSNEDWLWNSVGGQAHGTNPPANTWVHVGFTFTPKDITSAGNILLKFEQNAGSVGTSYFDNIQISAIPEPSSLALLSLGIAGLAIRRARRSASRA